MTIFNIISQSGAKPLRPKSRIIERVYHNEAYKGAGVIYCVKVQVRILWLWVTVWAESCDFSDGDARFYIKNCAGEVHRALTKNS